MSTQVLDKGFVRLVSSMGDDSSIVQAARVSYGKGTKTPSKDKALIDYLVRFRHTSPLEMVEFVFHLKMPIFVARQWVRHRTASLNEISGRYSIMRDEFYVPEKSQIRYQSAQNKQGRAEEASVEVQARALTNLQRGQEAAYKQYEELLAEDISRELARINLPLSLYTEMYWKMDLHNLFHFLKLRLDDHAQYEIRVYAEAIADIVKQVVPLAYEAFAEHILYSKNFSQTEIALLNKALDTEQLKQLLQESDMRPTRQNELLAKLNPRNSSL